MTASTRLAITLLCLIPSAGSFVHGADTDKSPGFVSLFNGRDLTGWEGNTAIWTVRDGAIRCDSVEGGTRNWLIWRGGQPEDFELRLKFRFVSGNSGVQVRSEEIEKWLLQGYQVEVATQSKMGLWHHSIAPEKVRSHLAEAGEKVHIAPDGERQVEHVTTPEKIQPLCKDNAWNDLTIIADGPRLIQIINGQVFAELIDEETKYAKRKGLIGFQDHGKETVVEFKEIRLRVK